MNSLDPVYVSKKGCLFQDTTVATFSLKFLTGGAVNLPAEGGEHWSDLPPDARMPVESEGLCQEGGKMYYVILVTVTGHPSPCHSPTFLRGVFQVQVVLNRVIYCMEI